MHCHGLIEELSIVIGVVVVHCYVQRILCFSNILLSAYTALNKINDVTSLAISSYPCIEFFTSHYACNLLPVLIWQQVLSGVFRIGYFLYNFVVVVSSMLLPEDL